MYSGYFLHLLFQSLFQTQRPLNCVETLLEWMGNDLLVGTQQRSELKHESEHCAIKG